jgi:hypothetical protein
VKKTTQIVVSIIVIAVAWTALVAFSGNTTTAANAATVKPAVSWTDQTCHALEAWQRHHDATDLYRLIVNAAHLPGGYMRADMLELAADAASPGKNAPEYLSVAIQYADEDCFGGA